MSKETLVSVHRTFGIYHAHAGSGLKTCSTVSRLSGPEAATRAAAKYLGTSVHNIALQKSKPGVFRAHLIFEEDAS